MFYIIAGFTTVLVILVALCEFYNCILYFCSKADWVIECNCIYWKVFGPLRIIGKCLSIGIHQCKFHWQNALENLFEVNLISPKRLRSHLFPGFSIPLCWAILFKYFSRFLDEDIFSVLSLNLLLGHHVWRKTIMIRSEKKVRFIRPKRQDLGAYVRGFGFQKNKRGSGFRFFLAKKIPFCRTKVTIFAWLNLWTATFGGELNGEIWKIGGEEAMGKEEVRFGYFSVFC